MVLRSPFVIVLSVADRGVLTTRARSARTAHRDVIRARIILAAAGGRPNAVIAAELGLHVDTVRKWRKRFHEHRMAGLGDLPRAGRPPRFTPVQVAEVKALACSPPPERKAPLARWSAAELADQAVTEGLLETISAATVRPLAGRRCDQALAAPVLDLPPRSALRRQGRPGAGPVRTPLGRRRTR